jgi:hypothetical protein
MFLTHSEVENHCRTLESEIRLAAHLHNLPYVPLIPSVRAYALSEVDWPAFLSEYRRAIITAAHSGLNFAYID